MFFFSSSCFVLGMSMGICRYPCYGRKQLGMEEGNFLEDSLEKIWSDNSSH